MTLHVTNFGGGVVTEGAPDTRNVNEVLAADSYELGTRGALVCASDCSDYVMLVDADTLPAPWSRLLGLLSAMPGFDQTRVLAVGEGKLDPGFGPVYLFRAFSRQNEASPAGDPVTVSTAIVVAAATEGAMVTGYAWPGVWTVPSVGPDVQVNIACFCLGAREGFAPKSNGNFGLYIAMQEVGSDDYTVSRSEDFNMLGTGPSGDGVPLPGGGLDTGTDAQQLYFRGVIAYNNHAFGWGFDSADAANGDGPARVMFSNLGRPLKYGNDNIASSGNRLFTDSDAIVLGDAGELVRGAIKIFGKLFFGTNRSLHFISGYGRDSFLTDGATPVMRAFNTVGPNGLIEGPDKRLYGCSDQGLWRFDGASLPEPLFQKLVDYDGASPGYWDLIWTDPTAHPASYPGRTNQDLIWMAVDWERHQVLVGIPFCNSATGAGAGSDTVVVKFHVLTGGFTRQVFAGVAYTAAGYFRREGQERETRLMATASADQTTIQRYGYRATAVQSPPLPRILPTVLLGDYAVFGPDGDGVVQRLYLTLSWVVPGVLPLTFRLQYFVDQTLINAFTVYIGADAAAAVDGDLWLDTSETNTSIGNGTAAGGIPARGGFLLYTKIGTRWSFVDGQVATGLRTTIPIPVAGQVGARVRVQLTCLEAHGRYQLEGFGLNAGEGEESL